MENFNLSENENLDEILTVLLGHIDSQPDTCGLLRESGALSDTEILEILEVQSCSGISFKEAAIQLSKWEEKFDFITYSNTSTTPELPILRSNIIPLNNFFRRGRT